MKVARCQGARKIEGGTAEGRPFFVGVGGFTLTELVVVISIVAILSVYAVAKFTGGEFNTRAATDRLFAQISFARKVAIAQHRPVCVHLSANESVLRYGTVSPDACGAGNPNVPSPAGPSSFTVDSGGTVFGPEGIYRFDALGRYVNPDGTNAATLTVQINAADAFVVERDTGYVHP